MILAVNFLIDTIVFLFGWVSKEYYFWTLGTGEVQLHSNVRVKSFITQTFLLPNCKKSAGQTICTTLHSGQKLPKKLSFTIPQDFKNESGIKNVVTKSEFLLREMKSLFLTLSAFITVYRCVIFIHCGEHIKNVRRFDGIPRCPSDWEMCLLLCVQCFHGEVVRKQLKAPWEKMALQFFKI